MFRGGGGEREVGGGRRKKRRRKGKRKRRRQWRRRHFTQTVKTKHLNTKQGCKKFVKQTWNPLN